MSVNRAWPALAAVCVAGVAVYYFSGAFRRPRAPASHPIQATFQAAIPMHNEISYEYLIENLQNTDFRIEDEGQVKFLGRRKATGELMRLDRVTGEFPMSVPARRKVHYALLVVYPQDIDPDRVPNIAKDLNLSALVLRDEGYRYEIDFPLPR